MLLFDFRAIGNNLLNLRKARGLTQAEVAEAAQLSDRTYADIERGNVNTRIETLLQICQVLRVTPDEILTREDEAPAEPKLDALLSRLDDCTPEQRRTAITLLSVYLDSL